jgi:hypothetical protein
VASRNQALEVCDEWNTATLHICIYLCSYDREAGVHPLVIAEQNFDLMKHYSWEQQRHDIQRDIDQYFRKRIQITPRAMAALQSGDNLDEPEEILDNQGAGVYEISILESLIRCSPGCATILFKAGVQFENFQFEVTKDEPAPLAGPTLELIFEGWNAGGPTATARRVSKAKTLTESDLLVSALEASLRGSDPNVFGGKILEAAGIPEGKHVRGWSPLEDKTWKRADGYLKKILKNVKKLAVADPSHAMLQFVLYEDDAKRIRVRPFGVTDLSKISVNPPIRDGEEYLYRGGVLQPIGSVSRHISANSLLEFESLLNSTQSSEADFQRFFENNPLFLTGIDFAQAHPQPILYNDEGNRLIPDFFLEKLSSGWDTILDLKRPFDEMVTRRTRRTYFKQHVQNAIAQLRFYREWFESPTNRARFREAYGVTTFRPKMVVVIGRNFHFRDDVERIQLLDGLSSQVQIWTYDDVYERAKRYLALAKDRAT